MSLSVINDSIPQLSPPVSLIRTPQMLRLIPICVLTIFAFARTSQAQDCYSNLGATCEHIQVVQPESHCCRGKIVAGRLRCTKYCSGPTLATSGACPTTATCNYPSQTSVALTCGSNRAFGRRWDPRPKFSCYCGDSFGGESCRTIRAVDYADAVAICSALSIQCQGYRVSRGSCR